jgi:hypothetical protein
MANALKKTLQKAQKMGRGRDTILAHINPEEARLLKARGGAGTRNPRTGLLQFDPFDPDDDKSETISNAGESTDSGSYFSDLGSGSNGSDTKIEVKEGQRPASGAWYEFDFDGDGVVTDWNHPSNQTTTSESGGDTTSTQTTTTAPAPVPLPEQIRNELKGWGGTTEQIDLILNSLGNETDGYDQDIEALLQQLKEVPEEDRIVYLIDNFGDVEGLDGWGAGNNPIPLNDATRASELQKPTEQRLQEAVDRAVLGSSTGAGLEPNDDGSFTNTETGVTYYRADDGRLTDRDGNVWYDPGTGLADRMEANQTQADTLASSLYGPAEDSILSTYQQQQKDYNTFVSDTVRDLGLPENDFASQVGSALQGFLNGQNGQKGFLDFQSELLGAGEEYKRGLDTLQKDYDAAYAQNQTDIGRLRGEYNALTTDYASDLDPLRKDLAGVRDRLGDVSAGQMQVAKDAGDETYYGRLKNLYYADARDNIDSSVDNARDALQSNFAAAGADPNSPAYTAAIMDLQQNRANALQSARRQAVLDSYGLGSQMLGQRSQALAGAGSSLGMEGNAIGAEMGALNSLYGVRSQGLQADANLTAQQMQNRLGSLNTRGDMIGQLYNVNANNAQIGMQGANTILDANLKGIGAQQDQFYKNMGLTNDLYRSNMDVTAALGNAIGSGLSYYTGQADKNFQTLLEANQGGKSDAFAFAQMENWFNENDQEMPDFLERYRPSST